MKVTWTRRGHGTWLCVFEVPDQHIGSLHDGCNTIRIQEKPPYTEWQKDRRVVGKTFNNVRTWQTYYSKTCLQKKYVYIAVNVTQRKCYWKNPFFCPVVPFCHTCCFHHTIMCYIIHKTSCTHICRYIFYCGACLFSVIEGTSSHTEGHALTPACYLLL